MWVHCNLDGIDTCELIVATGIIHVKIQGRVQENNNNMMQNMRTGFQQQNVPVICS
jgi:hypothetical protein